MVLLGCLSGSTHQALTHSIQRIAGEIMELVASQEPRPWERPFWKPVHGKEGVFSYLVIIHFQAGEREKDQSDHGQHVNDDQIREHSFLAVYRLPKRAFPRPWFL